jgi:hypothetical protein
MGLARQEAQRLSHNYIGTEHLLLGLIREQEGIAAQVLQNIKVRLEDVREEVLGCEPVWSKFHHIGLHEDRLAGEALDTILTVLAEMHFGRAEQRERPDIVLTFEPQERAEWMFHLGRANALEIPIILLHRPGESADPLLEARATHVAIDGNLEASLRTALSL